MAVHTPLSNEVIAAFLTRYNVGDLVSATGILEGIENTNYLLKTTGKPYILTVFEQRVNEEELPFFMELTDWLKARGIACPNPVHAHDGSSIQQLANKPAALIEFLDGKSITAIGARHCLQVGELCARMHLAAKNFPRSRRNPLSLGGWRGLFEKCEPAADSISPGLADEVSAELAYLRANWPCDLPSGVVHTDLFPDNVFFNDNQLSGVIDFYFACTDAFAYDLMITLNAWCFDEKHQFRPELAEALLAGYQSVRPLTAEEVEMLPVLARGAAVRFLATRSYDWLNTSKDALVTRKDPLEYLAKLRFHRKVSSAAAYGIAA